MIIIESKSKIRQLNTVLSEIKYLRGMNDFLIDRRNSNRYRVMVKEALGYTAYCFSTPIYSTDSQKLVNLNFKKTNGGYSFKGSNGSISIYQNRCVLQNRNGRIIIFLKETPTIQGDKLKTKCNVVIVPTLNGMRFVVNGSYLNLLLKSETKQEAIRFNSNCFSIMSEKFRPFFSLSALYARDGKGSILPVEMKCHDKGNQTYEFCLFHEIKNGTFLFEVNLYEPKLFQDTTVESINPDLNNVYGAIGFIGNTKQFGEQWLYLRPDFSKIPDLTSERIEKVFLHIPVFNGSHEKIDVFIPEKRFCSFGLTWNKKVNASAKITSSNNSNRYLTIDVTTMFTNSSDHTLVYNEGLILKKPNGKNNFIPISTGDCYSAPQILEIKFK